MEKIKPVTAHLKPKPVAVVDNFAGDVIELLTDGADLKVRPTLGQSRTLKQHEQVIGEYADAEESGVAKKIAAGKTLRPHADLELLEIVLRAFATLVVKGHDYGGFFLNLPLFYRTNGVFNEQILSIADLGTEARLETGLRAVLAWPCFC